MPKLSLTVGGETVTRWTEFRLSRKLASLNHTFEAVIKGPGIVPSGMRVGMAECRVESDSPTEPTVLDGLIVRVSRRQDESGTSYTIAGSTRPWLLIGSSVVSPDAKSWTWGNIKASEICEELIYPYGIGWVYGNGDDQVFKRWKVERGAEVASELQRVAKATGKIISGDKFGHLSLWYLERNDEWIGPPEGPIAVDVELDFNERYSEYLVRNQYPLTAGLGRDYLEGLYFLGTTIDHHVKEYRPLWLDIKGYPKGERSTAPMLERNLRAGRSKKVRLTFAGAGGYNLPDPGMTYRIPAGIMPDEEIDGQPIGTDWIIDSVQYVYSEEGSRLDIELVHPFTYDDKRQVD